MSRSKLSYKTIISAVEPHPNADRLDIVYVAGWVSVAPRGLYFAEDVVLVVEEDALLPNDSPIFDDFKNLPRVDAGKEKRRLVRRTNIRGVRSEVLVIPVPEILEGSPLEVSLDSFLGLLRREERVDATGRMNEPFDTSLAPKTDAERFQNLVDHWADILVQGEDYLWIPTLKVDGTSRTLHRTKSGEFRLYSRNWRIQILDDFFTGEREHLKALPKGYTVQFELYGEGINGNRLGIHGQRVYPFAAWTPSREKIDPGNIVELIGDGPQILPAEFRPVVGMRDTEGFIAENLKGFLEPGRTDEGVVYHWAGAPEYAPKWAGPNANFKILNLAYLEEHGL